MTGRAEELFVGAVCMALTTWMRSWQDFELVTLATLPMFLFSATFFPLDVYPEAIQRIIQVLPLWHAVELVRGLTLGQFGPQLLIHVGYFVGMIAIGIVFTTRRLRALFLD